MDSSLRGRTSQGFSEEVNSIRKMPATQRLERRRRGTKAWAGKRAGHRLGTGDHYKLRLEARSFRALIGSMILSKGHWNATEGRDMEGMRTEAGRRARRPLQSGGKNQHNWW